MKLNRNRNTFTGLLALVLVLTSVATGVSQASAADAVVRTVAKGSVDQVLDGLKKMVADHGMMVMGELHQGKVLEMTGLKVQSETIFVGNPAVGKQFFEIEPGAGVVLPVRVNIFQNAEGKTVVAYIPPSRQLAGFGNPMLDKTAAMLDEKFAGMVGMLGK